ncbi:hypothetical protein ACE939_08350 [Aquimarina sp. W85]|uniref:hypothetical protein n=1 Tax=Aquimarina rhodophyticola TaxID=3342246 RepID=UPI00366CE06C
MELLKLATEWAKAEVFSTRFFILFSLLFLIASISFWQLGKTDLAKAYIIPTLVASMILMTISIGLFYTNKSRIVQFEKSFNANATTFYQAEIERSEGTIKEYTVVFKVIPMLIIVAAFIILFVNIPIWRAISITTIALLTVILLVDGTAYSRIEVYHKELKLWDIENEI